MSPEERTWRDLAAFYRRPLPDSQIAAVAEERADLIALEGVDFSLEAPFRPGPGDALALRGEG